MKIVEHSILGVPATPTSPVHFFLSSKSLHTFFKPQLSPMTLTAFR